MSRGILDEEAKEKKYDMDVYKLIDVYLIHLICLQKKIHQQQQQQQTGGRAN